MEINKKIKIKDKNIKKSNSQTNIHNNIGRIKEKLNAINENMSKTTTESVCERDARIYIFKLKDKLDKSNINSIPEMKTPNTKKN